MPQPFKKGVRIYEPQIIKRRPEHAIGIALVVSEWSALEDHLFNVFAFALFVFQPHGNEAQLIAQSAWNAMDSLRAKLDFIDEVAQKRMPEDLRKAFTSDLVPELRKRAGERNRVVHGKWSIANETPDVVLTYGSEEPKTWTVQDFQDTADRIIATSNKVATFWHRVQQRLMPEDIKQMQERLRQLLPPQGE